MKRFALAMAALLLSFSGAPRAEAELPQYIMDRLEEIPVERATEAQRNQIADTSLATWRDAAAAPAAERARLADIAMRAAFVANKGAETTELSQALLNIPEAEPMQQANARLVQALQAFGGDAQSEAQLSAALAAATPRADGVLRARAARALAIAHMRRDEQPEAQARWREMEVAAGDIPTNATYDFEIALIGRAASHGYAGQGEEGVAAVQAVVLRMGPEMAQLRPAREATAGEIVYANALAWRSAFRVQNTIRHGDADMRWYQVGDYATDSQGRMMCPGDYRLRPAPRYPANAGLGGWQGSTVIRLATDEEGHVIYAEAVAAVPPIRAFSYVALQLAPDWTFRPEGDRGENGNPCRLQAEGRLIAFLALR